MKGKFNLSKVNKRIDANNSLDYRIYTFNNLIYGKQVQNEVKHIAGQEEINEQKVEAKL